MASATFPNMEIVAFEPHVSVEQPANCFAQSETGVHFKRRSDGDESNRRGCALLVMKQPTIGNIPDHKKEHKSKPFMCSYSSLKMVLVAGEQSNLLGLSEGLLSWSTTGHLADRSG